MRRPRDETTADLIFQLGSLRLYQEAAYPSCTDEDGPLRVAIAAIKAELRRRVEVPA